MQIAMENIHHLKMIGDNLFLSNWKYNLKMISIM
jgi:hypothetical protein